MSDANVSPITDEELAWLEADIADGTILGLYCDGLIARIRAAEARAETAERERDALVAKVHEVYAQGHNGPLWKVREWMNAHITGAKGGSHG